MCCVSVLGVVLTPGSEAFGLSLDDVPDDVLVMVGRQIDVLRCNQMTRGPGERGCANNFSGRVNGGKGRQDHFQR